MRLSRARVANYRSVKDTGWFHLEASKTALVGLNEAGKTAVMRALERLNPGRLERPLMPLRDYPASEYHRIQTGEVDPANVVVAEGIYFLEDRDREAVAEISPELAGIQYQRTVYLDNHSDHFLVDEPERATVKSCRADLRRLAAHVDGGSGGRKGRGTPSAIEQLDALLSSLKPGSYIEGDVATALGDWLDVAVGQLGEEPEGAEAARLGRLRRIVESAAEHEAVLELLEERVPVMVYYANYTRVQPSFHLGHLADMIERGEIDQSDSYNFGNYCLLRLLNFSARELSDLGRASEPTRDDPEALERYRDQLDERSARLSSASLRLTREIRQAWQPSLESRVGASEYTVRIVADQQYLKVVVEDSLGLEIPLDQRSEGFQWLVSFFIVFFAETTGILKNAVLLLDEPGLSLHGLKQREFAATLSRLAEHNQLLFTTHSPFMLKAEELPLVRVVEMPDRLSGTKVHSHISAEDPAALLPLQEAIGYDMAESLFGGERNLLLESIGDFWYVEATASLLREAVLVALTESITLLPAGSAAKVAYLSTVLQGRKRKVAALLDSDAVGDHESWQDALVEVLGDKRILRTKDVYDGPVKQPRLEELLRQTLVAIGRAEFGWDVADESEVQPERPIIEIFSDRAGSDFSRYRLAKAYVRWTRAHKASDLTAAERQHWTGLITKINAALK